MRKLNVAGIQRRLDRMETKVKQVIEKRKDSTMSNQMNPKKIVWNCSRCHSEQVIPGDFSSLKDPVPSGWKWIDVRDTVNSWLLCSDCVAEHERFMTKEGD